LVEEANADPNLYSVSHPKIEKELQKYKADTSEDKLFFEGLKSSTLPLHVKDFPNLKLDRLLEHLDI
jgi:hypothetical protein